MLHRFILVAVLVVAWAQVQVLGELSCEEKGFDSELVQCKTCEKLKPLPDGDELYEECMECCSDDKEKAVYSSGTMIYCSCKFRYDPQLAKLVASIPEKFPNMKTKDVHAAKLQLEMQTLSGETETVSIDTWSHDNVIDFLTRKLEHK